MAVTESGFSNNVVLCVNSVDLVFSATRDFKFLFLYTGFMAWKKHILKCPNDILGYVGHPLLTVCSNTCMFLWILTSI